MFARRLLVILVFTSTAVAHAVGTKETARLTISGPGLASPLEVTDTTVLAQSNVFSGTFIAEPASAPVDDRNWTRFTIAFDIQTTKGIERNAYVLTFAKSRWTEDGLIYLPGRGDTAYRRNIGTILREGQDGQWHRAAAPWAAAIIARLP